MKGISAIDGHVLVNCYDAAGAALNSVFTLHGAGPTNTRNIAYATGSSTGALNNAFSFNPSGSITATRTSLGVYTVAFAGLNGAGGTVQVSAVTTTNARCNVDSWTGTANTGVILVGCTAPNGARADSGFSAFFLPSGARPASTAYLWANQLTSASYNARADSYNWNAGGVVTVTRSGTGAYSARFPGLFPIEGGVIMATALGDSANGNYCHVSLWATATGTASDLQANVVCFQPGGTPVDSPFLLLVLMPPPPPALTLTCNPAAGPTTVGVRYSSTCTAAGGLPPYSFFVSFSAPANYPAGLATTAVNATTATVTGTPTTAGGYNYNVVVRDSQSPLREAVFNFTGTIAAAPVANAPTLTLLNPATATAGGAAFALTVSGTNFAQNAQILWNGTPLSTTFSSSTQLTGAVPAALIASANTVIISVTQSGTASNALPFVVQSGGGGSTSITALPHIAVNGPYVTGFYVVNTGAAAAQFKISFTTDGGLPLSVAVSGAGTVNRIAAVLPGFGSAYYEAGSSSAPLTGGAAQVSADAAIAVQALFRLQVTDGYGKNSFFEAAVNPSAGSKAFVIPFDVTSSDALGGQVYTGVAISNLDPAQTATVTCIARDTGGNTIPSAVTVPPLPPGGHWADFSFPALTGSRGTLTCSSATSIGGLAIHALPGGGISTLPVILK